jgi:hypothetical protein
MAKNVERDNVLAEVAQYAASVVAFSDNYSNKNKYQMNTCNWRLYHLLRATD